MAQSYISLAIAFCTPMLLPAFFPECFLTFQDGYSESRKEISKCNFTLCKEKGIVESNTRGTGSNSPFAPAVAQMI